MNSLRKLISCLLIAASLALSLKPLLLHARYSADGQSSQVATQTCPNRVLAAAICLASGFYALVENEMLNGLGISSIMILLLSFTVVNFSSSWFSQRLLRPPICS